MSEEKKVGMGMLVIDEETGTATYKGDKPPEGLLEMLQEKFGIEIPLKLESSEESTTVVPEVKKFYVITDEQLNMLVNKNFKNIKGTPFNYRAAYENEHDSHMVYTDVLGDKPEGQALARLEELGRGEWHLNELAPSLFLNELVRYGNLPAGDYIVKAE